MNFRQHTSRKFGMYLPILQNLQNILILRFVISLSAFFHSQFSIFHIIFHCYVISKEVTYSFEELHSYMFASNFLCLFPMKCLCSYLSNSSTLSDILLEGSVNLRHNLFSILSRHLYLLALLAAHFSG